MDIFYKNLYEELVVDKNYKILGALKVKFWETHPSKGESPLTVPGLYLTVMVI